MTVSYIAAIILDLPVLFDVGKGPFSNERWAVMACMLVASMRSSPLGARRWNESRRQNGQGLLQDSVSL